MFNCKTLSGFFLLIFLSSMTVLAQDTLKEIRTTFDFNGNKYLQILDKKLIKEKNWDPSYCKVDIKKIQEKVSKIVKILSPNQDFPISSFVLLKTSFEGESVWYCRVDIHTGQYQTANLNLSVNGFAGKLFTYLREPFPVKVEQNYSGEKRDFKSNSSTHLVSTFRSDKTIFNQEISSKALASTSNSFNPMTDKVDFSFPASRSLEILKEIFPGTTWDVDNVYFGTNSYSESKNNWFYKVFLRLNQKVEKDGNVTFPGLPSMVDLYFDLDGNYGEIYQQPEREIILD